MATRVDDLLHQLDPNAPWRERVRAALYSLHRFLAADARAAELLLVELRLAAEPAPEVAERWTEAFFDLIDEGRDEPTASEGLGRMTVEALGGGIYTQLYAAIVRDGALPPEAEIVPELMYCLVLPYCGHDAAREELGTPAPPEPAETRVFLHRIRH